MKKIAAFVANPIRSPYKHDQYDSFRSEGRITINMGFGLSLLGFEVNIIMNEWDIKGKKQVWENVYLSNVPLYEYYDYILTWETSQINKGTYDKLIFMDWNLGYIDKIYQLNCGNVIYTNIVQHLIEYVKRQGRKFPIEVNYLPPLYPIPSINIGFIPYNDNDNNKLVDSSNSELKIYIYCNTEKVGKKFIAKQQFIIDFIKKKFKGKIKLYVYAGSRCIESLHLFGRENIIYLYEQETRYIDIIDTIRMSDICIMVGSNGGSPSLVDTISLGKPTIFISDEIIIPEKDVIINNIYEYPEYIFYTQEDDKESIKKLKKFILNPKESYDKFKEAFKDWDFNNWKVFAKQFFV
jgi:hypothetical protein